MKEPACRYDRSAGINAAMRYLGIPQPTLFERMMERGVRDAIRYEYDLILETDPKSDATDKGDTNGIA